MNRDDHIEVIPMARANRPPHPGSDILNRAATRPLALHEHNPPGAKLLRRFYKAKHGVKSGYLRARAWYRALDDRRNSVLTWR